MTKGWTRSKLDAYVAEFIVPQRDKPKEFKGNIPWCRIEDFNGVFLSDSKSKRYVNEKTIKDMGLKVYPINTVIVSCSADLGRCAIISRPLVTNQTFIGMVPSKDIDSFFLYYYMSSIAKKLNEMASGATIKYLSRKKFEELDVFFPSVREQKRIVAILNEAFATIAKVKENAKKNLINSKELLNNYLHAVHANPRKDWEATTLESEVDLLPGFAFKSKHYTESKDDVFLLRGDNIIPGGLRWTDVKRWDKSEYSHYSKYQLRKNDIVLAMDRPWIKAGLKCARLTDQDLPALLVQRTARLRNKPKIDGSFLYHIVKSKQFTDHLLGIQTGIGVPHISGQQILAFSFFRPPLDQQKSIVTKLEKLSGAIQKLESIYNQKLADLDELKKSILQKAFTGEL
jgi:type I restriction enzyme, S subunit